MGLYSSFGLYVFMVANKTSSKKAKGTRLEKYVSKRINQVLKEYGVEAKRMPMSGAIDGFKSG